MSPSQVQKPDDNEKQKNMDVKSEQGLNCVETTALTAYDVYDCNETTGVIITNYVKLQVRVITQLSVILDKGVPTN